MHAGGRAVVVIVMPVGGGSHAAECVHAGAEVVTVFAGDMVVVAPQRASVLALGSSLSTLVMVMVMLQGACMRAGVVAIIVIDAGDGVVALLSFGAVERVVVGIVLVVESSLALSHCGGCGCGQHCVVVALWWSELVIVTVVSWRGLGIDHISCERSAWVAGLHGVCGVGVHAMDW